MGAQDGRKKSKKSYESPKPINVNQNTKSVGSGEEQDQGYQSSFVKTLPDGLKVVED